jgi:hypothetical protein
MKRRWAGWVAAWALGLSAASAQELLPGPVRVRLVEVERIVAQGEKALQSTAASPARQTQAANAVRAAAQESRAKMNELEQRHAGEFSPFDPEMIEMHYRIMALELKAKPAPEPAAAEVPPPAAAPGAVPLTPTLLGPPQGSVPYWVARLRPFVARPGQPHYDPNLYLEPFASPDRDLMQRRLEIYAVAAGTLTEYRMARLGPATTTELRQLEVAIEAALRRFGISCLEHANQDLADAEQEVKRLEQFVREQQERMAAAEPLHLLDRDRVRAVEATLQRAARLVRPDDPCLVDVRERLAALKRADSRLRAARAADTQMRPDVYAGADAGALRQVAAQAVLEAAPGIRLLRVALISMDWQQESYAEWADFDQQVLRQHVVRRLVAQVAAQSGAETRRYTVTLRQDRLPSGRWAPVAAKVTFVDPMLAENAHQSGAQDPFSSHRAPPLESPR